MNQTTPQGHERPMPPAIPKNILQGTGSSTLKGTGSPTVKGLLRPVRWVLYLSSAFALVATILLVPLARHTDDYFAWTIRPPLTAAVFGAFFWAAALFGYLSARQRTWADARALLPAAVVFTSLTLAATLIYIDRFHLSGATRFTRLVSSAWLVACWVEPPLLLGAFYLQLRAPGIDPPRADPLPIAFRLLLGLQSLIAIAAGAALCLDPIAVMSRWGWDLTPLTARALGAWLIPLGIVGAQAIWENDWDRIRAAMISLTVLGVSQLVVFGIFYDGLLFENAPAIAWVAYCLLIFLIGGYGAVEASRASRWDTRKHQAASAA